MAQIAVTLEQVQHRDQRKHTFATPISTTVGIGNSYTITPNGTGAILLDTLSNTEYTVSESESDISAIIAADIDVNVTNVYDDYYKRVSSGDVVGQSVVNKFGANSLVVDGIVEDVWDYGGTYSFPTTADITSISQATDQAALRGGTIEVQGLDANWDLVTQTKDLDATNTTTIVTLDTPLIRIFRMKVLEDVVSSSNITASNSGGGTIYAEITAGNNQTLMAIYTVPNGYTALMTNYYASTTESTGKEPKSTEIKLWVADRDNGYEFQLKHATGIPKAGSQITHLFQPYFKITQKSDIKITALPDSENASVHAGFDLILEQN